MSRAAAVDLKVLKRIMPGLRRLALFAAKSVAVASTETCIELADLEKWVKEHGRPTPADIEDLEDQLAGVDTNPVALHEDLGETVRVAPPEKPIVFSKAPPPAAAAQPVKQPAPRPAAPPAEPPPAPRAAEPPPPPPMKATTKVRRKSDNGPERWRKIAQALLDNPDAKESELVKKAGIPIGSWGGFKVRTFGKGKISPEKLQRFLGQPAGAAAAPAAAKAPKRGRKRAAKTGATPPHIAAGQGAVGCPSCGGFTVHVRCRGSLIEVCPTCLAEREQGVLERTLALAEFVAPKASAA